MTFRKKRLIQEKNFFLEKKYIFEQATPITPTPEAQPSTPSTPQTPIGGQGDFKVDEKVIKTEIEKKNFCSNKKVDAAKFQKGQTPIKVGSDEFNYYLTEKKDGIFCIDKIIKK